MTVKMRLVLLDCVYIIENPVDLLWAAVEKIKVAKLEPDALILLPDELVVAGDIFGVGAGVSERHELAILLHL